MKVGEYIRTKGGIIDKVIIEYNGKCASPTCNRKHVSCEKDYYNEDEIIKSSTSIIDLIEVGDYVNGHKVIDIAQAPKKVLYLNDISQKGALLPRENIKSIVTHEQFSQMEYRIGE